jgi:wyosine [tRNA(Phe)-imidazoG37] synthetase (radical SAM superfamily)
MKTVFGPVLSRRLGQSLGIDPVPSKACNWNCVYCQLGRTKKMVVEPEHFISNDIILAEVKQALTIHAEKDIDWITFIGSGETTLHAGLGEQIRQVKKLTKLPIAVITNGSRLYDPDVREALRPVEAVMPSVDAGDPDLYRRINRPHPQMTFKRLINGLKTFRLEYTGQLWVEVMLVKGLNDTKEALHAIRDTLLAIQPDQIHIMQPTRPPAETWVKPPDEEGLLRAKAIFGEKAMVISEVDGRFDLSNQGSLVDALVSITQRHPMREDQILKALSAYSPADVNNTLSALEKSGEMQKITRYGVTFWTAHSGNYGKNRVSSKAQKNK